MEGKERHVLFFIEGKERHVLFLEGKINDIIA